MERADDAELQALEAAVARTREDVRAARLDVFVARTHARSGASGAEDELHAAEEELGAASAREALAVQAVNRARWESRRASEETNR